MWGARGCYALRCYIYNAYAEGIVYSGADFGCAQIVITLCEKAHVNGAWFQGYKTVNIVTVHPNFV